MAEQTKKTTAPTTNNTSAAWVSNIFMTKGRTRYYGLVPGLHVKK